MRPRGALALVAALCLGLGLGAAPARAADTLEVVEEHGPTENRIDLVITGDGYTAAQADLFRQHVDALLDGLFGATPWAGYRGLFNLYRVVTESAESGADHPSRGEYHDTYFEAQFDYLDVARLTYADEAKVINVVTGLVPAADLIVLLINDPEYGGSGGSVAMVSAAPEAVTILVHELGHTLANLADEYTDPYPYPAGDPEPNVDLDSTFAELKWNAWIEPGTPLPTALGDATGDYLPVGAYEGARYLATGIFRSAPHCIMQSLQYRYCDVCREAMVLGFYAHVDPIDAARPPGTLVTVDRGQPGSLPVVFEVDAVAPSQGSPLEVTWTLGGQPVGTGPSYAFDPGAAGVPNGPVTLTAEAVDPTLLVRSDPNERLRSSFSWTLTVTGEPVDAGAPAPDGAAGGDAGSPPDPGPKACGCGAATEPGGAVPGVLGLLLLTIWLGGRRRRRLGTAPSPTDDRTRRTAC